MQVASRLYITLCILYPAPSLAVDSMPYRLMVLAWSVTEVVRYAYYCLNLCGRVLYPVLWARYTFFWVLYPIGAGSEWIIVATGLRVLEERVYGAWGVMLHWIVLAIYVPGFYKMYTHMIHQRKKYLKGGADGQVKRKKKK
jgi:very-long-chain (3R)-3-hydroxyacyl-CoA dehydratase